MRQNNRALAGVLTAALALSVAVGVNATADTDTRTSAQAPVLTKAEKKAVKKIATRIARKQGRKQANRAITRRAPGLTVGKALTADLATKATLADAAINATNAQNAAVAAKIGDLDVKKFSLSVPSGGPGASASAGGMSLTLTCAAGTPNITATASAPNGKVRWVSVNNAGQVTSTGYSSLTTTPPGPSILGTVDDYGSAFVQFHAASGQVTSLQLGFRTDSGTCLAYGNYISG